MSGGVVRESSGNTSIEDKTGPEEWENGRDDKKGT